MTSTPPGDRPDVAAPPPPGTADLGGGEDGSATSTVRRSLSDRFRAGATQTNGADAGPPTQADASAGPAPAPERPARPAAARPAAARPASAGPRRVRLALSRIDPWSAMKLSFLLSVALGIMLVVAAAVVWFVLDSMHVFADIEDLLVSIGSENFLRLMDYLQFDRVISFATIVGVVDILLLTALGTIGAFLYNIVAALVGGLHVTLTDD
ncbi:DUF3566 domain-containing protein [Georgenia sp. AZ-5]|uniref:DUF3566 domain-containing protein n=1 Tax=Georgenia sp. AZ-5 TaxID=3367526 RepID=UPI00375467B4